MAPRRDPPRSTTLADQDAPAQAVTAPVPGSTFDVIATRETRMADFLRESPGAMQAVRYVLTTCDAFSMAHGFDPSEIMVSDPRTSQVGPVLEFRCTIRRIPRTPDEV